MIKLLKITPYLGILVLIVSIGGLWYPVLGYFMLIVFAAIFLISPFRGRWFCGNLCPRGSLVDFWVGRISKKRKIPKYLRSFWLRVPIFLMLMGLMSYRIINVIGTLNAFEKIGLILASICLVTTSIAIIVGSYLSPRAWCTFCPMGTVQRVLGGEGHRLKLDEEKCIKCGKCEKICPMQLKILENETKDCIKCGRCIEVCPKDALKF